MNGAAANAVAAASFLILRSMSSPFLCNAQSRGLMGWLRPIVFKRNAMGAEHLRGTSFGKRRLA